MATIAELRAQAEELLKKAAEQEQAERKKLFDGILDKLEKAGESMQSLMDYANPKKQKGSKAGSTRPAKYRGPNGELWAGVGRKPGWMEEAIKNGATQDSFLIK